MIDHWLDERGQKVSAIAGRPSDPEMGELKPVCFPGRPGVEWAWVLPDGAIYGRRTSKDALAILRDHALEYLVAFATRHACCLSIASPGSGYEHWYIAIRGHGRPVVEIELADFDAALVATIHAVEN